MGILTAHNFNVYYKDFHALKDISIDILPNQVTSFIGPSGCGKSTFLKSINRMNDLVEGCRTSGELTYKDTSIADVQDLATLRRKIGMVFQKANPFPMSIYDNIAYGPRTHGIKNKEELDKIVEQSLKDAALWDEVKDNLNKNALRLSGGQQQRLCIARALAVQPEILLMDEPTSALDPISTAKIEDLILKLKEKYTIVIVTHNMAQSRRISDQTAFFWLGELVEYGPTKQIFENPRQDKTRQYISGDMG